MILSPLRQLPPQSKCMQKHIRESYLLCGEGVLCFIKHLWNLNVRLNESFFRVGVCLASNMNT